MKGIRNGFVFLLCWIAAGAFAGENSNTSFRIPAHCKKIILGISSDWDNSYVTLRKWKRNDQGKWIPDGDPWPGRIGSKGLAWGRGLHPEQPIIPGPMKVEGDYKSPAGVFLMGGIYGYAADFPRHPGIQYNQITSKDLWVEDVNSPYYNQHLRLVGNEPLTEWQKKQQMKQNDPVHKVKMFIHHNAYPNAKPSAGSSIFFHIWRADGQYATTGCTSMPEGKLIELLKWLDPNENPLYVLLPQEAYNQLRSFWDLP